MLSAPFPAPCSSPCLARGDVDAPGGGQWQFTAAGVQSLDLAWTLHRPATVFELRDLSTMELTTWELMERLRLDGWAARPLPARGANALYFALGDAPVERIWYWWPGDTPRLYLATLVSASVLFECGERRVRHRAPASYYQDMLSRAGMMAAPQRRGRKRPLELLDDDGLVALNLPVPGPVAENPHDFSEAGSDVGSEGPGAEELECPAGGAGPAAESGNLEGHRGDHGNASASGSGRSNSSGSSSSSSNGSSSEGDGESREEGEGDGPEASDRNMRLGPCIPARPPPRPSVLNHSWGCFRLTLRTVATGSDGGPERYAWFARCPFHKTSDKTSCTRTISFQSQPGEFQAACRSTLLRLRWWCLAGVDLDRRWKHKSVEMPEGMRLIESVLDAQCTEVRPIGPILSDADLDALA